MKTQAVDIRIVMSIGILSLAALATAVIAVYTVVRGIPLPGYVETVAGFLIGFATHELGVSKGAALGASSGAAQMAGAINAEETGTQVGA